MRVLLVGHFPLPGAAPVGGVQSSIHNLLPALWRRPGLDVSVVSFIPGLSRRLLEDEQRVRTRYFASSARLGFSTGLIRERRKLARVLGELRPDVVHAQDSLISGYTALRAEHRLPVVVSIHGIVREEVKHLPRGLERARMRMLAVRFEQRCVREAKFLVAPTRYPEIYFGEEIRGRIRAIGNPIADAFFAIERRPEPGRILFAGAVSTLKRVLDLVDALPAIVSAIPSTHLVIAGSEVDADYAALVRSRVRTLTLEARVTFAGQLSADEMRREYARASVLALPSSQEASPMVIGEAMAASVPVVATRVGGVEYLVERGQTAYLVEPGDVADLAAKLAAVLADSRLASSLGHAAREKAETNFKADLVAERLHAVYVEAAES